MGFKPFGEIERIGMPYFICDFRYVEICLQEQLRCLFQSDGVDEIFAGYAGNDFDLSEECCATHVHGVGDVIDLEVRLCDMFVDIF